MEQLDLKAGHAAVKAYHRVLGQFDQLHIDHEMAVRSAFQGLLSSISKWDIFHYIYAVLHRPTYRERYAANLRWELPRIPFFKAGPSGRNGGGPQDDKGLGSGNGDGAQADKAVFWALVKAGERLADLGMGD